VIVYILSAVAGTVTGGQSTDSGPMVGRQTVDRPIDRRSLEATRDAVFLYAESGRRV